MKLQNYLVFTGLFLLGISCSEREISIIGNSEKNTFALKPSPGACDETVPVIRGTYLANGTTSNCTNNIMVFASMELYENTIANLEMQVDSYNDAFDQLTIGMTDEQADDYAESIGFDEDKPITDFENQYNFCSLRKKVNTLENQWLDQQGDGSWNLETDPDSYYIDDDVERALLNEQSEVLIGTCATGLTLYKFYSWGHLELPLTNSTELTDVLTQLNSGNYPLALPININGSSQTSVINIINNSSYSCVQQISENNSISSCSVIYTEPTNDAGTSCQKTVKNKGENVFNSNRRIKWKHKFIKLKNYGSGGGVHTRAKSLTKSFRKKNGKWKAFKTTIAAGISGYEYEYCGAEKQVNEENQKRRKRIKLKTELQEPSGTDQKYQVKPNSLFSIHKQDGNVYQKEIYQY